MVKIQYYTVDAFSQEPFSGNPAAVCLLQQDLSDQLKQSIAREMNISETCFLTKEENEDFKTAGVFGLRWFTPTNEVPLCGHATLAAATVLFKMCDNTNDVLKFKTLSGTLEARRRDDMVLLDLPVNNPTKVQNPNYLEPLIKEVACGLPVQEFLLNNVTKKLLVRLKNNVTRAQLENIKPDTEKVRMMETTGMVKGVILTAMDPTGKYHFLSRYFAPWNGIPEDPVTGSAHTVLAPYWRTETGLKNMSARQCSPRL